MAFLEGLCLLRSYQSFSIFFFFFNFFFNFFSILLKHIGHMHIHYSSQFCVFMGFLSMAARGALCLSDLIIFPGLFSFIVYFVLFQCACYWVIDYIILSHYSILYYILLIRSMFSSKKEKRETGRKKEELRNYGILCENVF